MIRNYRQIGATNSYLQGLASGKTQGDGSEVIVNAAGLLLHGDGVDGGTIITDQRLHTMTASSVITTTGNKKFGNASMWFGANSSRITSPRNQDFVFGIDPFTIDCWFHFSWADPLQRRQFNFYSTYSNVGTENRWVSFTHSSNSDQFGRTITVSAGDGNGTIINNRTLPIEFLDNQWYHIAWVVSGRNTENMFSKIFINGIEQTIQTDELNYVEYNGGVFPNTEAEIVIGETNRDGDNPTFNANLWLDEYRMVKGKAAWTSNFTPPTAPYS